MKRVAVLILIVMVANFVYGEKLATLEKVMKPVVVTMDNENLYVVEGAKIHIYSLKNYKLKSSFGKEGEGPQEFKIYPGGEGLSLVPYQDTLIANCIGKVLFFTKEGKFIKEFRTPSMQIPAQFHPLGNNYAGLGLGMGADQSVTLTVNIYDANARKLKELTGMSMMHKGKLVYPVVIPIIYVSGNQVITPGSREQFEVLIFDSQGNKSTTISREVKTLGVTDKYKEGVYTYFKTNALTRQVYDQIKQLIKFDDVFPPIQLIVVDKQTIYIQTFLEKENQGDQFFVYDLKGGFIKEVFIPIKKTFPIGPILFTIKDGFIYQLQENEDEETWEIFRDKI